jgi:FixJ family two-component response regulator
MSIPQPSYVAVIDDEESICHSMSRLLRAAGFQPVTYCSVEALLADTTKHPRFEYLVLDTRLGVMSVMELHRRLSAANIDTPIIFIKAQDGADLNTQAEAFSRIANLRKTSSGTGVLAATRRAVNLEDSDSGPNLDFSF